MQSQTPDFASIPCILAHRTDLLAIGSDLKFEGFALFHPCMILWPMEQNNDMRHSRHCLFLMCVHLVFVTKYRRGVFTKEISNDLRDLFSSVCRDFEVERVAFDGEDDHVHHW
jgi:putative transposase